MDSETPASGPLRLLRALPQHGVDVDAPARLVSVDDTPVALLQTYEPAADPVAETYPVQDSDLGVHLLLAPARSREAGFTARFVAALGAVLLGNPAVRRIVVGPDAGNELALERVWRTGFELGPEVDLPQKPARLAFLHRETLEALSGAAGISG
ncbi:GNAT family N-acetyltransferase [Blastococcus sp. SYSU DS1024]